MLFGKSHGGGPPDKVGPPPDGAPLEAMGSGWMNAEGTGFAESTMTDGIEGSWTPNPTRWNNDYLENLFRYEWKKIQGPQDAIQWTPEHEGPPRLPTRTATESSTR